jgi:drug/metabolite transporter (DMT)-like permease
MTMALCDTISLYINLLASHNIGGSLRLILQQLSIPFSMMFSYLLLGRVFTMGHVGGAVTVVLGVLMCLVNVLKGTPGQESDPVWTILFMLSCIPLALGGCLKEYVLLQQRCDANFLNARVSLYQLLLGFCLVPLGMQIQNLDTPESQQVSTGEIWDNFWTGFKCGGLGITLFDEDGFPKYDQANCGHSLISTWLYVFTVCGFNLLMIWVIREGTAVLFFVASGVTIPLVSLLSSSPIYEHLGLKTDKFTPWQLLGLTFTVGGCIFFGTAMIKRSEDVMQQRVIESIRTSARTPSIRTPRPPQVRERSHSEERRLSPLVN